MEKDFCVYILTNKRDGVLYIGVTSNLLKRVYEHRSGAVNGFTKKYNAGILVYYEKHDSAEAAITREKQMKKWRRQWKIELIETINPGWNDPL